MMQHEASDKAPQRDFFKISMYQNFIGIYHDRTMPAVSSEDSIVEDKYPVNTVREMAVEHER